MFRSVPICWEVDSLATCALSFFNGIRFTKISLPKSPPATADSWQATQSRFLLPKRRVSPFFPRTVVNGATSPLPTCLSNGRITWSTWQKIQLWFPHVAMNVMIRASNQNNIIITSWCSGLDSLGLSVSEMHVRATFCRVPINHMRNCNLKGISCKALHSVENHCQRLPWLARSIVSYPRLIISHPSLTCSACVWLEGAVLHGRVEIHRRADSIASCRSLGSANFANSACFEL